MRSQIVVLIPMIVGYILTNPVWLRKRCILRRQLDLRRDKRGIVGNVVRKTPWDKLDGM